MPIEPGTLLASKYRVGAVIGTGGMGVVVSATHVELDQPVAIKLPLPQHAKDPTFAARFMREGRNVAKIRNDHVARVLDVGRDDEGNPFLVMELLEGVDLSHRLRAGTRFTVPEAVDLLMQACEAVAAAHAVGIVHRDLKPGNLFLEHRPDGWYHVKVLDFGISKVLANDPSGLEAALTNTTGIVGSPMYMSPEQMIAARDVDVRTDVWSLGLILYKILTGKTPWPSQNPMELATRIARDPPNPPRAFRDDIPEALENVILHAIERDRERRIATVYELAAALAPFDPVRGEASLKRVPRPGLTLAAPRRADASGAMSASAESGTMATSAITLHTVTEDPAAPVDPTTIASHGHTNPIAGAVTAAPTPRRRMYGALAVASVVAVAGIAALVVVPRFSADRTPSIDPTADAVKTSVPAVASSIEIPPAADTVAPSVAEPATTASATPSVTASASASQIGASPIASSIPSSTAKPLPTIVTKPTVKPTATATPPPTADPWGKW